MTYLVIFNGSTYTVQARSTYAAVAAVATDLGLLTLTGAIVYRA